VANENINAQLENLCVPIGVLKLDPKNARKHEARSIEAIKKSYSTFAQNKPVVALADGTVISGNGQLEAARALGWERLAVVTFMDEKKARAFALADNRSAELSSWDAAALPEQIAEVERDAPELVDAIGWDARERDGYRDADLDEPDEVPELPSAPVTKRGDLWTFGTGITAHRLLCGDASDLVDVDRIMQGRAGAALVTDPPYNLGGNNAMVASGASPVHSHAKIKTADWDQAFDIATVFPSFDLVLAPNATAYIFTLHHLAGEIWKFLAENFDFHGFCAWAKPNPMPSLMKRHWTWNTELVCYATRGKHTFNFPNEGHALSTWQINKGPSNKLHPALKPLEVMAHPIKHSTVPGDLVVDLFLGAGSTLIAAQQTERVCYGTEISPAYCDVIVERWQNLTGGKASRIPA